MNIPVPGDPKVLKTVLEEQGYFRKLISKYKDKLRLKFKQKEFDRFLESGPCIADWANAKSNHSESLHNCLHSDFAEPPLIKLTEKIFNHYDEKQRMRLTKAQKEAITLEDTNAAKIAEAIKEADQEYLDDCEIRVKKQLDRARLNPMYLPSYTINRDEHGYPCFCDCHMIDKVAVHGAETCNCDKVGEIYLDSEGRVKEGMIPGHVHRGSPLFSICEENDEELVRLRKEAVTGLAMTEQEWKMSLMEIPVPEEEPAKFEESNIPISDALEPDGKFLIKEVDLMISRFSNGKPEENIVRICHGPSGVEGRGVNRKTAMIDLCKKLSRKFNIVVWISNESIDERFPPEGPLTKREELSINSPGISFEEPIPGTLFRISYVANSQFTGEGSTKEEALIDLKNKLYSVEKYKIEE
jgi:hypothetical protein